MSLEYRYNSKITNDITNCINEIKKINYKQKKMLGEIKNNIKKNFKINDSEIEYLGKGGQGIVYLLKSLKCGSVVFKISNINKESSKEIFFLKKIKNIIDNDICPHFIYSYTQEIFDNKYYMFMEFADGTLENWLEEHHTVQEWKSFMFQILYGVFVLQEKLQTYHADLKPKNILYKKIKNGYFKYIINNETYYVPTYGYLFLIADFGKSQSMLLSNNEISNESIIAFIKDNNDLEHIESLPKRILVSALEKKYNFEGFVEFMDGQMDANFKNYLNSEKEKIYLDLSKYPEYIKKKMLLRSIIYYAIEKKYISVSSIPEKYFQMKFPPEMISDDLEKIFSLKDPVYKILTSFYEYKINKDTDIIKTFIYIN